MSNLESRISALQDELENLRRQKMIEDRAMAQLTVEQKLAVELHAATCHHNHADACGWHYEIKNGVHEWARGSSHEHWLGRANKISAFCRSKHVAVTTAVDLFKFMGENR